MLVGICRGSVGAVDKRKDSLLFRVDTGRGKSGTVFADSRNDFIYTFIQKFVYTVEHERISGAKKMPLTERIVGLAVLGNQGQRGAQFLASNTC